jgi:hypothetical protein
MAPAFEAAVLDKYNVSYFHCSGCGFGCTEEPYWLDEAYQDPLTSSDTGLVQRNLALCKKISAFINLHLNTHDAFLDFAGGCGLFVRLMRDRGFDFYWIDKYSQNVLARGFESIKSKRQFAAVTAFEVIEHVSNPVTFFSEVLEQYSPSSIIFSTELYSGNSLPPKDWWYYLFNSGQHISFYRQETLQKLAKRLGLHFFTHRGIHVLTKNAKGFHPLRMELARFGIPALRNVFNAPKSKTLSDSSIPAFTGN